MEKLLDVICEFLRDDAEDYLPPLPSLVNWFHQIDTSGQGLRYPADRNGTIVPVLQLASVRISLSELAAATREVSLLQYTADEIDYRASMG